MVSSLKLNALDATFVDLEGDLSPLQKLGQAVAFVWCGDGDVAAVPNRVYRAVETGVPVVALLPAVDLFGVDPTVGKFEVCFPPYSGPELMIRMHVAESRVGVGAASNLISRGELTIDCDRYEVSVSRRTINLTIKEFKLLEYSRLEPRPSIHPGRPCFAASGVTTTSVAPVRWTYTSAGSAPRSTGPRIGSSKQYGTSATVSAPPRRLRPETAAARASLPHWYPVNGKGRVHDLNNGPTTL